MYVQFQKCYDTDERGGRFLLLDCSRPDSHKALYVVGQAPHLVRPLICFSLAGIRTSRKEGLVVRFRQEKYIGEIFYQFCNK